MNPSVNEIAAALRLWEEKVYEAEGEVTPELLNEIRAIEGTIEDKAEACAYLVREFEGYIGTLAAEEKRLAERREIFRNRSERIKERLSELMRETNREKIETARFTIGFRKSLAVVIDDETQIPAEYIKETIERKPMKKELGEALKESHEIPGCHLEERKNLQIR